MMTLINRRNLVVLLVVLACMFSGARTAHAQIEINDDELIALLAKMDRPAGLIRSEGRIWLTNKVTDEELGISYETPDEDPSSM